MRRLVAVIDTAFSLIEYAGSVDVFRRAGAGVETYRIINASPYGGAIVSDLGACIETLSLRRLRWRREDTVLVFGRLGHEADDQPTVDWLATRASQPGRMCAIGAGQALLKRALGAGFGLEKSRSSGKTPAATAPVGLRNGRAWFCAGNVTAIDVSLHLVAEDFGRSAATEIAANMLLPVWRSLEEPATSTMMALQLKGGAPFAALHDYIRANPDRDLRVEALADFCGMSPRTFARLYRKATGLGPAEAVRRSRLELARQLADQGLSRKEIAARTGLGSERTLRRAIPHGET